MTGFGLVVFLFLLLLAKMAKRFRIGPQWLQRFTIEKHTYY